MRWSWWSMTVVAALAVVVPLHAQQDLEDEPHVVRVVRQILFSGPSSSSNRQPGRPGGGRPGGVRPGGGRPGGGRPGGGFVQPGGGFVQPGGGFVRPGGGGQPSSGGGNVQCSNCRSILDCPSEFLQISGQCVQSDGTPGFCCPQQILIATNSGSGQGNNRLMRPESARINVRMGPLDSNRVNEACQKGIAAVNNVKNIERDLVRNNMVLKRRTPASGHLRVFKTSPRAKRMDQDAQAILAASTNMVNDFRLTPEQGGHGLRTISVSNTVLSDRCPRQPDCSRVISKYRTADGSCNNQKNPTYGMSNTPVQRILPPTYDDGMMAPRTRAVNGGSLPRARDVSNNVLLDVNSPDQQFTLSVMQWAQFLDHDFAHIPFPSLENGEGIECCPNGQEATGANRHPRCWPIDLTGDNFYGPRGRNCMNFIRSMVAVGAEPNCNFGFAEQLNQLTHWIDGSMVYGSTLEEQRALRDRGGLLLTSGNNLLPFSRNQGGDCEAEQRGAQCYAAGDSRVNEQPGLTAMHTLWLREHNRVARNLKQLNPSWSDEAVFQETRRIIVAEIQHITFNEWLPIIVGPNYMRSFGIHARQGDYSQDYSANINPNMNNEFATGAFRFGHTLVQGTLNLYSANGAVTTVQLRNHFNSPHLIQRNNGQALDSIVRSLAQFSIQEFDNFVTKDLSNHLFQTPTSNFGMDLMSLNIHRGRDHGIATYNNMREICGLRKARDFSDLIDQMEQTRIQQLARIYASVDDIDFFVGGLAEKPVAGGLLGYTFLCVVGDQFARLKKGDRYFYDGVGPGAFNPQQLAEIRRSSWARIICDNSNNIASVQPLAFRQTNSRFNQPTPCTSPLIPRPNLEFWRGEPVPI